MVFFSTLCSFDYFTGYEMKSTVNRAGFFLTKVQCNIFKIKTGWQFLLTLRPPWPSVYKYLDIFSTLSSFSLLCPVTSSTCLPPESPPTLSSLTLSSGVLCTPWARQFCLDLIVSLSPAHQRMLNTLPCSPRAVSITSYLLSWSHDNIVLSLNVVTIFFRQ